MGEEGSITGKKKAECTEELRFLCYPHENTKLYDGAASAAAIKI